MSSDSVAGGLAGVAANLIGGLIFKVAAYKDLKSQLQTVGKAHTDIMVCSINVTNSRVNNKSKEASMLASF